MKQNNQTEDYILPNSSNYTKKLNNSSVQNNIKKLNELNTFEFKFDNLNSS